MIVAATAARIVPTPRRGTPAGISFEVDDVGAVTNVGEEGRRSGADKSVGASGAATTGRGAAAMLASECPWGGAKPLSDPREPIRPP